MARNDIDRIPEEYKPISMWGYFGYEVLFSVPVIGWICVIIFALTAENLNLRNFARSQFCMIILYAIAFAVAFIIMASMGTLDALNDIMR